MTLKPYPISQTFTNPFASIERTEANPGRINLVVPNESVSMLMRIRPRPPGIVTTSINILYVKLLNAIIERGLDDPTRVDEYTNFILNCEITYRGGNVPNGTALGTMPQAKTSNVSGGTEGGNPEVTRVAAQPSRLQSTSRAKGRRERKSLAVQEGGSIQ